MAVSMADIKKLREMTGAGMMDCKKALEETNSNIEEAISIIRKKGQAVAAKREDREAAEGCALGAACGDFAAAVALKCETDFVAKNEGFVALTKKILDAALAAKAKTAEEVNDLVIDDRTVKDLIVEEIGKTGEKMELGAYEIIEAPATVAYNHFGNKLVALVGFNKAGVDETVAKEVAMQVAAMNPIAATRDQIPQATIDNELAVAIDKTKAEQVQKAVDNAIKKAGYNAYYCQTEEHLEEAIRKGYMTEEQVADARAIKEKVAAEKAANLPEQMIQNIAQGRLNKFFKENVLMEQEYATDNSMDIATFLKKADPELKAISLKRLNLNAD